MTTESHTNETFNTDITIINIDTIEFTNCIFNNSITISLLNFYSVKITDCVFNKSNNNPFILSLKCNPNTVTPTIQIQSTDVNKKTDLSYCKICIGTSAPNLMYSTNYLNSALFNNVNFDYATFLNWDGTPGAYLTAYDSYNSFWNSSLSFNGTNFSGACVGYSQLGLGNSVINSTELILDGTLLGETTAIPAPRIVDFPKVKFPKFKGVPLYNPANVLTSGGWHPMQYDNDYILGGWTYTFKKIDNTYNELVFKRTTLSENNQNQNQNDKKKRKYKCKCKCKCRCRCKNKNKKL